jgi:hypothetical protein
MNRSNASLRNDATSQTRELVSVDGPIPFPFSEHPQRLHLEMTWKEHFRFRIVYSIAFNSDSSDLDQLNPNVDLTSQSFTLPFNRDGAVASSAGKMRFAFRRRRFVTQNKLVNWQNRNQ